MGQRAGCRIDGLLALEVSVQLAQECPVEATSGSSARRRAASSARFRPPDGPLPGPRAPPACLACRTSSARLPSSRSRPYVRDPARAPPSAGPVEQALGCDTEPARNRNEGLAYVPDEQTPPPPRASYGPLSSSVAPSRRARNAADPGVWSSSTSATSIVDWPLDGPLRIKPKPTAMSSGHTNVKNSPARIRSSRRRSLSANATMGPCGQSLN